MKEWFIPINKLVSKIKFIEELLELKASINGTIIGALRLPVKDEREIDEFKKRVIQSIGRHSSSTILITRCGCERIVERYVNHRYLVPLKMNLKYTNLKFDALPFSEVNRRTFEDTGKIGGMGLRIFEEIED